MIVNVARPRTVEGALDELSTEESIAFAGGQSLVVLMNAGLLEPARLVSLAEIGSIRGVSIDERSVTIGAMATHQELATHKGVRSALPGLAEMFAGVGNIRVRCTGTLGGNLVHADPAQDPPVLLTALGASVVVASPAGRRELAVEDVPTGPLSTSLDDNELLCSVRVPLPSRRAAAKHLKFLPGTLDDYATVSVGVYAELDDHDIVSHARVVGGACGPFPIRLDAAAAAIVGGGTVDADRLDRAAALAIEAVAPSTDRRGSADYKRAMIGVIARRAIQTCLDAAAAMPSRPVGGKSWDDYLDQ